MSKKEKTATDNQWASPAGDPSKNSCTCSGEKKKSQLQTINGLQH